MSPEPDRQIHPLLRARWSPYGFSAREITPQDLASLFDAARHAPSAFNAQPWHYIVGVRGDAVFARILGCLVASNQAWARHAAALALGIARETFAHNGKPNAAALHDLGAASAHLCLEATARGIQVHQMVGLDPAHAQAEFAVPPEFRVFSALALGYAGQPDGLAPELLARDASRRPRRAIEEFVFGAGWGAPPGFLHR
jgi:nitroreductase